MPEILTDEQIKLNIDITLEKIAVALITGIPQIKSDVVENQKTIRNGIVQSITGGLSTDDILVLYQKEQGANPEDISPMSGLTTIVSSWGNVDLNTQLVLDVMSTSQGGSIQVIAYLAGDQNNYSDLTPYVGGYNTPNNPINVSQFINLGNKKQNINSTEASEYLNTNIYELLPTKLSRQQRVDDFFKEYQALKGNYPQWIVDPVTGDLQIPGGYNLSHDISSAQTNSDMYTGQGGEEGAFITRLDLDANLPNAGKTIQSLRNDLNLFLEDIDQDFDFIIDDERPEYENKSDGFLKIRNLNQGIIIRKQEGDDIGLERIITIPDTPSVEEGYVHPHNNLSGPSYLMNGFTITEWVRFLDKTSTGTLFNYGNPIREVDPKGFKLETFVLNKNDLLLTDDTTTWEDVANDAGLNTFDNADVARFVRLVVYDHISDVNDGIRKLYDSRNMVNASLPRSDNSVPEFGFSGTSNWNKGDEKNLITHTQIPIDFNEWFFVVASYNPLTYDKIVSEYKDDLDYWNGNRNLDDSYTHNSGYGSKCKVEVISKTKLLTARGYKV